MTTAIRKTIWKFPLELHGFTTLSVPLGASFLSVQMQDARPTLWLLVDPDLVTTEPWEIRIVGTGHQLDEWAHCTFLGTVQYVALVFHVFRVRPENEPF